MKISFNMVSGQSLKHSLEGNHPEKYTNSQKMSWASARHKRILIAIKLDLT